MGVRLVGGEGDEAQLRFEGSDTSVGLAPESVDRLFDAFAQADSSTKRRYGGTGLGLTISRRLVELMGGEIGCTSRVAVGSSSHFDVSLGVSAVTKPPRLMRLPSSLRVLVVDDNATTAPSSRRTCAPATSAARRRRPVLRPSS